MEQWFALIGAPNTCIRASHVETLLPAIKIKNSHLVARLSGRPLNPQQFH